jgi:ribosome-associated protein
LGARADLIARAISLIQEKKGEDIVLIDLRTTTIPAGFFLIAQGENPVHVRALAEELLEKMPIAPQHEEGLGEGRWALLDYGEFVVHLFDRATRAFYDLEGLWSDRLVRRW